MKTKKILASVLALGISCGAMATVPKTAKASNVSYTQSVVTKDTIKLEKKVEKQKKEIKKLKKIVKTKCKGPSFLGRLFDITLSVASIAVGVATLMK